MTPSENNVPLPFKVCRRGLHTYDRSLKCCPECYTETKRQYYVNNREAILEQQMEHRQKDIEHYKKRMKEYHAAHREEAKAKKREKYLADPEGARRYSREYARAHSEYGIWKMMTVRCTDKKSKSYPDYGGRGITVCPRWFGVGGFENFLQDMGARPSLEHQLNRKNNDGNYEPDNCCWSTRTEQCRNRRNNLLITIKGKTQTLAGWVEEFGMDYYVVHSRITKHHWSPERVLTTPSRPIKRGYEKALFVEN